MDFKPHVFIGSSKEGLYIAEALKERLNDLVEITIWTNAFDNVKSNFSNLTSKIALYDYAVIIATADDTIVSRKKSSKGARDNVLFEFGLFTGGLGASRAIYILEKGSKIPTDLLGVTFPFLSSQGDVDFIASVDNCAESIREHIKSKEDTFDLGFLPSTALAYGYFKNFVEKTVKRLLEDKRDKKEFALKNGDVFFIKALTFTILIPDDLSDDMFNKVAGKRLKSGWVKLQVAPQDDIRDYDFSVDISKAEHGEMHLVDIPYTLNALNMAIDLYSAKEHLGKNTREQVLEYREIRNFKRTLEYLIKKSAICKDIVKIEIVDV
ncbi:STING domain-containing protein [Mucilaginibacter sp. P25]|uniref:CD-NTase-associated protein 12 n=1 Tax=Mucilaginibacter gossypii TaxID=551996 RepID=A0A1G7TQ07_9SPHI|nr:STING domain-containing protein [Mucilaginibacter gossypii]SDG37416.1 Predicted nucleotide-binding protein containing TIR-like domain-containing protein [Mucilaginibacter gossypii]